MAQLASALLELLADPETHEPLTLASERELESLRDALASGRAARRSGAPVTDALDGALLSQGRKVAYLIEAGIPNLLIEERVELSAAL